MNRSLPPLLLVAALLTPATPAQAQFFSVCRTGSRKELARNISAHSEHTARLNRKMSRGTYYSGPMSPSFVRETLRGLSAVLARSPNDRAAVLFYAHSTRFDRLCTWLLHGRQITEHVSSLSETELQALPRRITQAMGVHRLAAARAARRRGVVLPAPQTAAERGEGPSVDDVLAATAATLLPPPIAAALADSAADTLVVLPLYGIEHVPFSALPLGDGQLVDRLSVFVAPGFKALSPNLRRKQSRAPVTTAVVVGDPAGFSDRRWTFPALPGARAEAEAVAEILGVDAMLGEAATERAIVRAVRAEPTVSLVYLATHGIASATHPLDGSFLLTADGPYTAREIGRARLFDPSPIVVMSACQTALGKGFEVGTMGLANAWRNAGASDVVMSLWNVDDAATKDLMVEFVREAREARPDRALKAAMLKARKERPSPLYWAGFTVFGVP